MSAQTQMTLEFLQRRIKAIQTDINDVTAMYLQAVSNKNIPLAEQCEITLRLARQHQYTATQALKACERPVRKTI
jgi:hypothetical protein